MAFLQKNLCNQTKLNSASIKKPTGLIFFEFFHRLVQHSLQKNKLSLNLKSISKRAKLKYNRQKRKNFPAVLTKIKKRKVRPPAKQTFYWIREKNKKIGNSAFITALFLPFLSLITTGLIGFASLSIGIKNITRSQSYCIEQVLQTQKALGEILTQLLKLNKKVSYMNKARKTVSASIKTATASIVLIPKVPQLIKMRDTIKIMQKALTLQQQSLLAQSFLIKKQALNKLKQKFKKLKASQVQDLSSYKKALAVQKEKIGSDAYIYKPVEDFKNQQKITFEWKLFLFYPLDKSWPLFKNRNSSYSCAGTLEQRREKWLSALYH